MTCNLNEGHGYAAGSIRILVEKVRVEGKGVILLTGPSSCGKGEIAKALCHFLSIPREMHLSMGEILRSAISRARNDEEFRSRLAVQYGISSSISIYDPGKNRVDIIKKAYEHKDSLTASQNRAAGNGTYPSQLDWLEFCVSNGLLVPDEWTEKIMDAVFESTPQLRDGIFILDGYPRTAEGARYLLKLLRRFDIPVIKVVHLYISKEQMRLRALGRKRLDDTDENLDRRYQFYIDRVQPCADFLKQQLGNASVVLVDAHQPVYGADGNLDVKSSINAVILCVMQALGLPSYLMDT